MRVRITLLIALTFIALGLLLYVKINKINRIENFNVGEKEGSGEIEGKKHNMSNFELLKGEMKNRKVDEAIERARAFGLNMDEDEVHAIQGNCICKIDMMRCIEWNKYWNNEPYPSSKEKECINTQLKERLLKCKGVKIGFRQVSALVAMAHDHFEKLQKFLRSKPIMYKLNKINNRNLYDKLKNYEIKKLREREGAVKKILQKTGKGIDVVDYAALSGNSFFKSDSVNIVDKLRDNDASNANSSNEKKNRKYRKEAANDAIINSSIPKKKNKKDPGAQWGIDDLI